MLAKSLKKGDTIGIVAPSKPFNPERKSELDNFIKYITNNNLKVKTSKNFYAADKYGFGAVTPEKRAEDINLMFTDKEIKAIWCLQGGELANQILDLIDFELIKNNPKIFMGKNDIDLLLLVVNDKTNLITFHSCDPKIGRNKELDFQYTKKWFEKRLIQKSKEIEPSQNWICVNKGQTEGKLLGCNICSILKLAGTDYFPDFSDSILFIETIRSNPSKLICNLTQLKQIKVFEKINGIVIGNNFEFQSDKLKVEEIVLNYLKEYNFPILKIHEFGHYQPHAFLPIGAKIKLDATNKTIEILDKFLE